MLTRLVKKDAVANSAGEWMLAGGQSSSREPHPMFPSRDESAASASPDGVQSEEPLERVIQLELRLRNVEKEAAQRSQASFQKGLQQGEANVRKQLESQVEAAVAKLSRSVEEISGMRQRYRHEAESDIVKLALAIARRVLHRELTVDPEAILGLVKAALDGLDIREIHRLRVHPEHAPTLRKHFESMGLPRRLEVEADPSLERGAALFETTHGSLDASAETQFAEIDRGFTDLVRHTK